MLDDAALGKRKFDSDKMLDDVGRCWIIPESVGGSLTLIKMLDILGSCWIMMGDVRGSVNFVKCWRFLDDIG